MLEKGLFVHIFDCLWNKIGFGVSLLFKLQFFTFVACLYKTFLTPYSPQSFKNRAFRVLSRRMLWVWIKVRIGIEIGTQAQTVS